MQIASIALSPAFLPLLAKAVPAGFPSPAEDHIEDEIDLTRLLVRNRPATFLVRVEGDSMIGAKLFDGDFAVVDRSLTPRNGDVVVVDIDGERSFKVWRAYGAAAGANSPFANPRYPRVPASRATPDAAMEVWGVVSSSISHQPPRARLRGRSAMAERELSR